MKKSNVHKAFSLISWGRISGTYYKFLGETKESLLSVDVDCSKSNFVGTIEYHSVKLNELSFFMHDYGNTIVGPALRRAGPFRGYPQTVNTHLHSTLGCLLTQCRSQVCSSDLDVDAFVMACDAQANILYKECNSIEAIVSRQSGRHNIYKGPLVYAFMLLQDYNEVRKLLSERNEFGEEFWDPGLRLYMQDNGLI